ncbi:MAG: alpha/beta fold hydrolase [Steroidobacteraceae bacterium]
MQPPDSYFRSGEIRLRYRDEGEGVHVVFIHGWTTDLDVWDPQAAVLGRSMRVIRLDRRGFGLSGGRPAIAADVDDLCVLIDLLQIPRVSIVGMSQGARVALAFALRFTERVVSLVLDGPPNDIGDPGSAADEDFSLEEFRELAGSGGIEAFRHVWKNHPLMQLHSDHTGTRVLLARMLARYPGRDLLAPTPEPSQPIEAGTLARFPKPVLVVNGEFDTASRLQTGRRLSRQFPLVERAVIPNAGHLPNLDNPGAYNKVIRAFMRRRSRAAA